MVQRDADRHTAQEDDLPPCAEGPDQEAGKGEDSKRSSTVVHGVIGVDFSVRDYLVSLGVAHMMRKDHIVIYCPACKGDITPRGNRRRSLHVSQDIGTWECKRCTRRGTFVELRRLLGDTALYSVESPISGQVEVAVPPGFSPISFHRPYRKWLWSEGGKARAFLQSRGINEKTMNAMCLGYSGEWDALVFPYLYSSRTDHYTSYIRFLRIPGDWWKAAGDPNQASWFGQHRFTMARDFAYVCQDPLTAMQVMSMGEENVLAPHLDTTGLRYRSHHMSLLRQCSVVYLVIGDTDEGIAWARSTQEQIGKWRCKIIQLEEDAIAASDPEGRTAKWEAAKERASASIGVSTASADSWIHEIDAEFEGHGKGDSWLSHVEPLDKLIGGLRPGELTVLSGETGIGKSTFASWLSLLQASEDSPCAHFSFEVLPKAMVRKWVRMLGGKPLSEMVRTEYVAARRKLSRRPILVGDTYGTVDLDTLRKSVYDAATRKAVRFVVLDHLGFVKGLSSKSRWESDLKREEHVVGEVKRWAMDLQVHIVLVAHMRKAAAGQFKRAARLDDVRGTSAIIQLADNVILLERERGVPTVDVRLEKVRDDAGYEGVVKLAFDEQSLRYVPA